MHLAAILHDGKLLEELAALLDVVDGEHPVNAGLHTSLVVDKFLLDLAGENVLLEVVQVKGTVVLFLVLILLEAIAVQIIGGNTKELLGLLVEKGRPRGAGIVRNGGREDVPSDAGGVDLLAPLAMPVAVGGLGDLVPVLAGLPAIGTGRVPGSTLLVLLKEVESSLETDPVRLVGVHAKMLGLDGRNGLALLEGRDTLGSATATGGQGTRRGSTAARLPPILKTLSIGNARHDRDGLAGAQAAATVISNAAPAHGDDGLVGILLRGSGGPLAPDGAAHLGPGIIGQGQLTLEQLVARLLADDGGNISDDLDDADDIDVGIGLDGLEVGDLDKVVQLLLDVAGVVVEVDLGILVEVDLALRLAGVVLHVGDLETSAGEGVDLVGLDHVVELVHPLLEEGGTDVGAGRIEELDAEQTALTAGVGPVLDVGLGCDASADGPTVHIEVELSDGDDVLSAGGGVANDGSRSTTAGTTTAVHASAAVGVAPGHAHSATAAGLRLDVGILLLSTGGIGGIVQRLGSTRTGTSSSLGGRIRLNVRGVANLLPVLGVDDLHGQKDDDVPVLDQIVHVIIDADESMVDDLVRRDEVVELSGQHALDEVLTIGQNDTVAILVVIAAAVHLDHAKDLDDRGGEARIGRRPLALDEVPHGTVGKISCHC